MQTQTARLIASDRQDGDLLGASVAVSGGVLVAGAPFDDNTFGAQGSAYVFIRPPGGWQNATEAAKLVASDPGDQDRVGSAVAISGDTIVLGAYTADVGAATQQGAAYVFESATWFGTMTQTAKLTSADGVGSDHFGYAVAVDGDTVVSGAILHATKGDRARRRVRLRETGVGLGLDRRLHRAADRGRRHAHRPARRVGRDRGQRDRGGSALRSGREPPRTRAPRTCS